MRIAVVGAGYVGLVSAACLTELGHEVVAVEKDQEKLLRLRSGVVPIHEPMLPELVAKHAGRGLRFSGDIASSIRGAKAVFITVGTPSTQDGDADVSSVEAVARDIAAAITSRTVVVEKSTVPVQTCEAMKRTMMTAGAESALFSIASNPEFLREGTAVRDFLYPDRIIVGADDEYTRSIMVDVYQPLASGCYYRTYDCIPGPPVERTRIIFTSVKSAELIKHACNAFLAMKISFINTVASISEAVGADVEQVCEGIGSDSRIGNRFLHPGIGYGGSCLPKDLLAFRSIAMRVGCDAELLKATIAVNERQRVRFLDKIRCAVREISGKRFAVLGLAFKGGTDDVRDSPAVKIVRSLRSKGGLITAFDPAAMEGARTELADIAIDYASDPYEACAGADALLILTDWKSFAEIDLRYVAKLLRFPVVIDGRNVYDAATVEAAGLRYYSIGRMAREQDGAVASWVGDRTSLTTLSSSL